LIVKYWRPGRDIGRYIGALMPVLFAVPLKKPVDNLKIRVDNISPIVPIVGVRLAEFLAVNMMANLAPEKITGQNVREPVETFRTGAFYR
jgi:hypothetical protein